MRARKRSNWLTILIVTIGVAALTGCREDEQDRVIVFEQGNYKGHPDQALGQAQVEELRSRAKRQQF